MDFKILKMKACLGVWPHSPLTRTLKNKEEPACHWKSLKFLEMGCHLGIVAIRVFFMPVLEQASFLAREILDKSEIKISKMTGCSRVWPHGPLTRSHIIVII